MATYKITGGVPLKGTVEPVPNKNSILKLIPAALLTQETVTIHNVPMSSDVRIMIKILRQLGVKVSYLSGGSLKITAKEITTYEMDPDLSQKLKTSVMFMGPLLMRLGKAYMPIPGGCKLGTRPLDAFLENMVQLGAKYVRDKGYFLEAGKLKGKRFTSWFPSVTATENIIMMAVLTPGVTEVFNAASEPHTQDLCNMLVSMGARIEGIGSNRLVINGVEKLTGTEWTTISDHLDIGAYIAAAALTGGEITINNAIPEHMDIILQVFDKVGIRVKIDGDKITVPANQKLKCATTARGDLFEIFALPWPALPMDLVQVMIVCALKAEGSMILRNSFQEFGMFWIEELVKMKAKMILADPSRVITFGPTEFMAEKIYAPNIIQATMALFLAALSAKGVTILEDASDSLLRRYPDLVDKYKSLGAQVEIIAK